MNWLEKYHLVRFCQKHGIDVQEIDDTLSYDENMDHLKEFVPHSDEDLEAEAEDLLEWFESRSVGERYGDIETREGPPLLIIGCLVTYSRSMVNIVRQRIKPFKKHVDMKYRGYLTIQGQVEEVNGILEKLEDVTCNVVRTWLLYDEERLQGKWEYLPCKGWVRKPDITLT